MHLFRGLSSKLIIPASVRPSVRPSVPLLGEAQNLWFRIILSEISENNICILQYLATVALKTQVLQPRSRALEVEEAQKFTESMEILWEKDTFRNIWGVVRPR